MGQNILVTGGAGYIGSILVPALLEAEHSVTVLDNFMYGQNSLAHVCYHPHFKIVRGDVRSESTIKPLLKKSDAIIPLAAWVGAPLCNQDQIAATTTNRDAIMMMTKHMGREQQILFPTTNSGYGVGQKGRYCTEKTPLRPVSLYGRLKVEAEEAVLRRKNSISFRLATVFGMSPRMRIDLLVNDFTYRAMHDRFIVLFEGHAKRNYIHIRDVARVFLHGLDRFSQMCGGAYNVGLSDANLSKKELCVRIKKHLPFVIHEAAYGEDVDKRNYIVSNEKIEKTGFKPIFSLDDGIVELIKGYTMIRNSRYSNV
ncbi:MAG: NAD(P)-dependent oxidoreductase [Candidatus Omnitrophica bacterium]|nr:NAD(P)-dependent oxidoreductase [Candidatus Omnitrophota bacterium]